MKSWFDEWMCLTREFLAQQYENYSARANCRPPSKFFLMGGSSNAMVLQTCIEDFLKSFFPNTELVLLGDCNRLAFSTAEVGCQYLTVNSATLVAYGAIIRAVTSVMSTRQSHYWIGLARKELFSRKKHANVPQDDIVIEDVPCKNGEKRKKEKQIRTIQWWAQPVCYQRPYFL